MVFDFRIIEYEIMRNKSDYCTLNVCIDNYFISNMIIKYCATKKTKSCNIVLRISVYKNLNLYNRKRYRKLIREFFLSANAKVITCTHVK